MSKLNIKMIDPLKELGKYFDGQGLYLVVTQKSSKLWRAKYRFCGKEKTASYGAYTETGIRLIRDTNATFRSERISS